MPPHRVSLLVAASFGATACAPALRPLPSARPPVPATPAPAASSAPAVRESGAKRPTRAAARPVPVVSAPAAAVHEHLPGVTFELGVHEYESDERVARYVRTFTGPARTDFVAQLERGTRYDGIIRAKLHAAGLPEEMRYLALIESGYDPQAVSRVGAVGMWQFMAGTARDVGLRVDAWIDERRDPVRSTDAAARNLKWLRSQFGSMFLAAAAYNGGETRVARGLAQLAVDDSLRVVGDRLDALAPMISIDSAPGIVEGAGPASADTFAADATRAVSTNGDAEAAPASGDARYFALASAGYIRTETKNYVPQLIAAVLVAKEPSRYGITVRPQPAFAFDTVHVAPLTPLAAVATAAAASHDVLLELNPQVLRGLTPPGAPTTLRVPVGRGAATARRLDDIPASERRAFRRATTKKRDTFAALAGRTGAPAHVLERYNPQLETVSTGKWKGRLVSGQAVRVPTRAVLAYARDVGDDGAKLTGLPMPAEEPRAMSAKAKKTKKPKA